MTVEQLVSVSSPIPPWLVQMPFSKDHCLYSLNYKQSMNTQNWTALKHSWKDWIMTPAQSNSHITDQCKYDYFDRMVCLAHHPNRRSNIRDHWERIYEDRCRKQARLKEPSVNWDKGKGWFVPGAQETPFDPSTSGWKYTEKAVQLTAPTTI